jgi:hypothetical protein
MASRPVYHGVGLSSGTNDQTFFFQYWQLQVSWCVASSLMRRWICKLLVQMLLGCARAVTLGTKSRRSHCHILLSHLRLPQPEVQGFRIYIPQEQGCPVIPLGLGFTRTFKFKLYYDRPSVGQFVLVSGPLWGPWPDFKIFVWKLLSSCRVPSLTRGRVSNLQCNHALVRVTQDP